MSLGRIGVWTALAAVVCAVGLLAGAGSALAETKTFTYTGKEQKFEVPAGVTSVEVVAVGSEGGAAFLREGGVGAVVGGKLTVKSEEVLYVEVGGVSFNGGGSSTKGGSGGGASDVRTVSIGAEPSPGGKESLEHRLLVAAGGGGGGANSPNLFCPGGGGGGAEEIGANGLSCGLPAGEGGGAGKAKEGGAGGAGFHLESSSSPNGGEAGRLGAGGSGNAGGGGGGGFYGGGGGGTQDAEKTTPEPPHPPIVSNAGNGGGGGGSNRIPTGGSHGLAAAGQAASVTITYTPASALATILVSDSIGQGPGHALADNAGAIQAAVNAGQTAIACEGITDYLGLVKAQTGKKLTETQASELTTDATNLAAALGC